MRPRGKTSFVGVVNGFPIPMRGNEFWTERAMIRGRLVSDPHEG